MNRLRKAPTLFILGLMLVSLTGVQGCEEILSEIEYILTALPTETTRPGTPPPGTRPPTSDRYSLYFTTPRYPDKDEYHYGGIDEKLVVVIDQAQESIDVAAYEFDLEDVAHALVRAKNRGVAVRMVTDTDNLDEEGITILKKAKIKVVDDDRTAIMHNKFLVIDGEWVWTGSWNLTVNGTYRNNNNAILIRSPDLALNYQIKFDAMFEDKEFGPSREAGTTDPKLTIQGVQVENYFAPEDEVAEKLVNLIKGAKKSIHFMAFSFTHDDIGGAMKARAKEGVEVRGVFETRGSDTEYSQYNSMRRAKLDVVVDGNPYAMHHKVIIIDGEIVVTGSYNFTTSADEKNDENVLIIHSPGIAAQFEAEFERVYETALNPPKKD